MIFVTVGTHEQPFNRLVEYIDNLKQNRVINEEIIIQTGYSTYEVKYCVWKKFYPYQQIIKYVREARIVITHGGPSSFIMPLQEGKIPIVVPRQKKYGEHVNDHQVYFATKVSERMGTIITVVDINSLCNIIQNYDELIKKMNGNCESNNARFNAELEKIVNELIDGTKE